MKKIHCIASLIAIMICTAFQGGQSIINNNNGSTLEIRYAGKFSLNDDETGIATISPDGFINFKKNDISLTAQPGRDGQVIYNFFERKRKVSEERGKKILAEAMREMIGHGLFAGERAERLYRKGGLNAVLNQVRSLKMDAARIFYFNWMFTSGTLPGADITNAVTAIGNIVYSDMAKGDLLNKVTAAQLKNAATVKAYLSVANGIKSDMSKGNALRHLAKQELSGEQWMDLIHETGNIKSGMEKSDVLSLIAQKMPSVEKIRTAYVAHAKTLKGLDYEKAMKALR